MIENTEATTSSRNSESGIKQSQEKECDHPIDKWNKKETRCKCGKYIHLKLTAKGTTLIFSDKKELEN